MRPVVTITTAGEAPAVLSLSEPDPVAVAIVRTVPGRRYHRLTRTWTFPAHLVGYAVDAYLDYGHVVVVDGRPCCRVTGPDGDALGWLALLPDRLRAECCRALADALVARASRALTDDRP
jgi:hypothetical protein